jgi:hypothetical protein
VGAEERLLGGVLGRLPAAGHGVGERDHPVVLTLVELLEPLGQADDDRVSGAGHS